MPGSRSPVSKAVLRQLNRLALVAAIVVTLLIPSLYVTLSIRATHTSLGLETAQTARALERIVMDRPELWDYETLRIQELIDKPILTGEPEDRRALALQGRELARTDFRAPWPTLRWTLSIHDSGRVVGTLEASRSIRPILLRTGLITLVSALVGWGLYLVFRLLPIRSLGQALADLANERRTIAATLRAIPDGIVAADGEGRVIFLNPTAEVFLGWTTERAAGHALTEVYPVLRPGEPGCGLQGDRAELRLPGRPPAILEERFSPLPPEGLGRAGRVIVFRDITTQLKSDAELLRGRQIESLGVLAGGIAHDFNNYLSAILGNISMARQDLPEEGRASDRLAEAIKATDRARALSLKLLTFAKGGDPSRKVVDLAPLVQEAVQFATHGTAVRFSCTIQEDLLKAEVDEGLFSQVIHNLVINSVQAMQGHGQIHFRLENRLVEAGEVMNLQPGRYLRVSLKDSGPGIPEAILPRSFEPYFTTKDAGHGLGLASCYNIMKAHGGKIIAESEPGSGAMFLVYVPATNKELDPRPAALPAPLPQGQGRVLVMEDDPVLQEIAAEMLRRLGFTAHTCADGESAIQAYAQSMKDGHPFAAVLMDLTIPGGMGGREAATRILALAPQARLIVSSGYSVDPVMARPGNYGFQGVLPKPYSLADLSRVLSEVVIGA